MLLLASCSDSSDNSNDTTGESTSDTADNASSNESVEETETDGKVNDDLGELNFDGSSFGIMTFENQNFHYAVSADETLAVPINDAMYYATVSLEDRFNVDIQEILYPDFSNEPRIAVMAGDNSSDLIRVRCGTDITYWKENLLVTADNTPYIDLEKPYWDKTINDSLTIAGTHFVALSSFDLCTYDFTFALIFNKGFISNFNLDNPYELVNSGEWTMDKMNGMMLDVVSDMDGNGEFDQNDRYGYVSHPKMVAPGFWVGAGVKSIEKDENDIPHLAISSESFMSFWEKLLNICYSDNQYYGVDALEDIPQVARNMFSENKALFMDMSFFFIEELRQMESDFGIIPYPKFSTEQENYSTRLSYYVPTIVPVTLTGEKLDRAGVMLEALACEYYNNVVPAYYEVVLKAKAARDEESQDMLDIIFESRVIDLGDSTFCGELRDGPMRQMFVSRTEAITSRAKSFDKIISHKLNELPGVSEE